ncbi:TolC family protein [Ottowia sp. VDI28]|uniref:TolC family protein n=1 Tax=Ottowia sp. VDI28 TaxID=3133968 RepID=UPI003C2C6264
MKQLHIMTILRTGLISLILTTALQSFGQALPAELPDANQAQLAIEQDPAVVQARHALEASRHSAAMIAAGPYEWTVGGNAQRRRTKGESGSNEWTVQIERPIRWGGKADLDRRLGQSTEELARAQLGKARIEAAETLLQTWLDWQAAQNTRAALEDQVWLAEENQRTVDLRRKAGDASRLESNVARADLVEARRQVAEAATAEAKALAALQVRYPTLPAQARSQPDPAPLELGEDQWRQRATADHPSLVAARQAVVRAELAAERVRAERTPDPTVGMFVSSEARRSERIVGLSVSIPIGGTYRQQAALESLRQVDVARAGFERQQRELELQVATRFREAIGNFDRWKLAVDAAKAVQETTQLSQKAYAAGELDVQALLLTRRQALEAVRAVQSTRMDALRARYQLLLDTGALWQQATR